MNIQRSIVISKEIDEKVKREAEELYTSANCIIRKILTDYYKQKKDAERLDFGEAGKR